MPTKEEHYHAILKNRGILTDPQTMECTCPVTLCEWHGRCRECVAIHRHNADHIPNCLLFMVQDKVNQLAQVAQMHTAPKPPTSLEYQMYVHTRDKLKIK